MCDPMSITMAAVSAVAAKRQADMQKKEMARADNRQRQAMEAEQARMLKADEEQQAAEVKQRAEVEAKTKAMKLVGDSAKYSSDNGPGRSRFGLRLFDETTPAAGQGSSPGTAPPTLGVS